MKRKRFFAFFLCLPALLLLAACSRDYRDADGATLARYRDFLNYTFDGFYIVFPEDSNQGDMWGDKFVTRYDIIYRDIFGKDAVFSFQTMDPNHPEDMDSILSLEVLDEAENAVETQLAEEILTRFDATADVHISFATHGVAPVVADRDAQSQLIFNSEHGMKIANPWTFYQTQMPKMLSQIEALLFPGTDADFPKLVAAKAEIASLLASHFGAQYEITVEIFGEDAK